ncbi:hypothetical protein P775_14860 [Puniceibacterium antarcticum]|uniref:HTH marR-type domain-containing protein n=1 Tax=Puniceibacterium antarcticum TaxID=1206336 RepID=A0A2G8RCY5_9RHOB|nr:MarR family winged helix-turn-helix transcriptional regulator [Puniceibacterium antarcticum]PIL19419.1 hypothetical protein P775_14860 [Puniceibacterium antarcticum]
MPQDANDSSTDPLQPDSHLAREFVAAAGRLHKTVYSRFDAEAKAKGLSFSRAKLLALVSRCPGRTQASLAREMEVEAPSLKRLVDGLEEQGYVYRCAADGDKRANGIFLTEKSQSEVGDLLNFADRIASEVLKGFAPEELTRAINVMNAVSDRMTK